MSTEPLNPDYAAATRFDQGIRQSLAWFDADPSRKRIDAEANAAWDKLIAAYEKGLSEAVSAYNPLKGINKLTRKVAF